jgi:broad specificity phosphatase PhoE
MREYRIILVRHGKPQIDVSEQITGLQLADWVQRYDDAPLDRSYLPPEALLSLGHAADYIMTSALRRSVESAQMVAPKTQHHVSLQVHEARLPMPKSIDFVLPAQVWINITGLAWFLGWSAQVESLQQVSQRANFAVAELTKIAQQQGTVLLVGHGIINLLIARKLRSLGWQGAWFPNSAYWGSSEYTMSSTLVDVV